ncbi:hypothetical protein [Magnetovibrio sp.]|uniref:hypothetical protein n=1 Tax=Magnetovibrio sp. TaxID=2024836 RepID=UPI002F93AE8E
MFENDPSTEQVENLIAEDEVATLRDKVNEVHACLRKSVAVTWIFTGKYSMPLSEHLIPFRT